MNTPAPNYNAFTQWREPRPGCQHQLGCKCLTPYYLRPSTEAEAQKEKGKLC